MSFGGLSQATLILGAILAPVLLKVEALGLIRSAQGVLLLSGAFTTFGVCGVFSIILNAQCKKVYGALIVVYIIGYFTTLAALTLLPPLTAWDAVSFWAPRGLALLGIAADGAIAASTFESAHPPTLSNLLAMFSSLQLGRQITTSAIPWFLCLLNVFLIIFSTSLIVTRNIYFSVVPAIIVVLTPVIENSAIFFGYAELFLLCSFVLIHCSSYLFFSQKSCRIWWALLFFCHSIFLCFFLKNTGGLYFVTFICCASISLFTWEKRLAPWEILMGFLLIVSLLLSLTNGQKFQLLGYELTVLVPSPELALETIFTAFLSNQSFSVVFSAGLLFLMAAATERTFAKAESFIDHFTLTYTLSVIVISVLFLSSSYGSSLAEVGSDTSFSRLMIPLAGLIPLLYVCLLAAHSHIQANVYNNVA